MTRKQARAKVGIIGLGLIGSRVAACLRGAGHQVYVWSRTPRTEPNFLGSAREVAELSDLLQLFVSDDAALLETVRAIAPALGSRHVVAGHATVSPAAARQAAEIVTDRGARYLDAPFTGSKAAAQSGQLVYLVAGPEGALREARPILEASGKTIVPIGGAPGQASVVKLATNLFIGSSLQALAEALALSRAAGVDPAQFAEALENSPARSGITDNKLPGMIKGQYEPHFALKHLFKDLGLALRLAGEHDLTLPITATVAAQVYGGVQRGWGDQDCSALARNFEPPPPVPVLALPPAPAPAASPHALPPAPVDRALPPPATVLPPAAADTPEAAASRPMPMADGAGSAAEPTAPNMEKRKIAEEGQETPSSPPTAASEGTWAASQPPLPAGGETAKPLPTLPMPPPVVRREATVRTPPPTFPFAPPSPRAPAERPPPAAPTPSSTAAERQPQTAPATADRAGDAAAPPKASPDEPVTVTPRRSLFASLFGKDK